MLNRKFCSLASMSGDEALFGTAPNYKIWVLIEYRLPWRKKAVTDNELSENLQAHLSTLMEKNPDLQILFIKQKANSHPSINIFIARLGIQSTLSRIILTSHADMLNISNDQIINGHPDEIIVNEPHFFVCTNGTRDVCCSKFGLPVYQSLTEIAGENAWQCSHIGGHRFAPTMLVFPLGIALGRVQPDDIPDVIQYINSGKLPLAHLRGRLNYPGVVQAAEYLILSNHKKSAGKLTFLESRNIEKDEWQVKMTDSKNNIYTVNLLEIKKLPAIQSDCDPTIPKHVKQYKLIKFS